MFSSFTFFQTVWNYNVFGIIQSSLKETIQHIGLFSFWNPTWWRLLHIRALLFVESFPPPRWSQHAGSQPPGSPTAGPPPPIDLHELQPRRGGSSLQPFGTPEAVPPLKAAVLCTPTSGPCPVCFNEPVGGQSHTHVPPRVRPATLKAAEMNHQVVSHRFWVFVATKLRSKDLKQGRPEFSKSDVQIDTHP